MPRSYTSDIPGFRVINTGIGRFGYLCDTVISRACEGFLQNRSKSKLFLLVASFMQPHNICELLRLNTENTERLRYAEIAGELSELPNNFKFDKNEPEDVRQERLRNEPAYFRKQNIKLPFCFRPGYNADSMRLCRSQTAKNMRGMSLRSILEGNVFSWGHMIITAVSSNTGKMLRTLRYKYITYKGNLVEQLFDMRDDPGETNNLATSSKYASCLPEYRRMLEDWESRLDMPPNVPNADVWRRKG